MMSSNWTVEAAGKTISAVFDAGSTQAAPTFIFAHGAGGHMRDRGMQSLATELCARGMHVVRFNFPYREQKRGRPDSMPVLTTTIAAVVSHARKEFAASCWLLGGRSMGGRAASMLVADGFPCDGLLLFAYPLHPAGKPEQLRDSHLARITAPVLCINGTRDPLCRRDLMDAVVDRLHGNWKMHWLEGADHSFHVLKSSPATDADVLKDMGDTTSAWVSTLAVNWKRGQ
jgi:predicted alpha/beta-hydrolase family hydrolase